MASAGSTSSVRTNMYRIPNCEHGLETDVLTSHMPTNHGRRFFCCLVRKWDDCDFFQWVDSPLPSSFCRNNCVRRMKAEKEKYEAEKEKYEAELKCNAMREELLSEKLKNKTQECELLKVKHDEAMKVKVGELEELRAKLEETINQAEFQKKWVWSVIQKMGVVMVIVSVLSRFV